MNAVAIAPGPASVVALGAAACGAVAWRVKGQLRLTVVVKASFDLVPGAPMTPAAAEDIVRAEVHHRNSPTQSVRLTTDLAPFLPGADAVLTGHAHAPEGAPAQALTVRFAVFRERALVEKLIHVYGDRIARRDSVAPGVAVPAAGAEVTPFEQMPLVYERAYGGLGSVDNPFGTGIGTSDKAPNLLDPQEPTRPACFAPISASLPSRKRMLDRAQREGLKQPIVDIVGDLSFQYFHAAPPDQRIAQFLQGNEWVILDGMHPTQRSVQSRLPDAVGRARVYGLGEADGQELSLVADTLRVDAERMTCSLVWRGHVPVPDEATLATLAVVGGVALGGQEIEWPIRLDEDLLADDESLSLPDSKAAAPAGGGQPAPHPLEGTVTVTIRDPERVAALKALPFVAGATPARALQANPAPRPAPPPQVPTGTLDGTLAIALDPEQPRARALPFAKSAPASVASASPAPPPPRPSPFAMGLQPAPPSELDAQASGPAPTFLKKAPRTLLGVAASPVAMGAAAPVAPRRQAARTVLGVELFPHGPLAIEVVPWGLVPARDTLTVIAKATCDLRPEGPLVARPAGDPPGGEAHAGAHCVYPSDLAPYKVRADVVLVGHAVAPGGSATAMEVSFRFGSGDEGFARRVLVFGDRRWVRVKGPLEPSAPEAFTRMPLAFDRAFGGPGFAPNPLGVGHHDPMQRGPVLLPNLEDPDQLLRSPRQSPAPAVFAPIPLAWKDRWAAKHDSGLCLAEALDWARFQAAPASQQLAFLRGDEAFAMAGLSARHPSIAGSLPGIKARCFVAWKGSARFDEVTLHLDTVVFDVDAMKVSLVWRGAVPVDDERAPSLQVQGLYLLADALGAETPLADARAKLLRP